MKTLFQELSELRTAAVTARRPGRAQVPGPARTPQPTKESVWRFPEDEPVVIVDTALPADLRAGLPYADPRSPDSMELYIYAQPVAVTELYGRSGRWGWISVSRRASRSESPGSADRSAPSCVKSVAASC